MKKLFIIFIATFLLLITSCDLFKKAPTDIITTLDDVTTTEQSTTEEQTTTTEEQTTTTTEDTQQLTDDDIENEIQDLIDATSYEINYQFRMKTDEIELKLDPLYKVKKYTDTNDKEVYQITYYNDVMEAFGLEALNFIVDERVETVYICNSQTWYKGTFDEVHNLIEEPIFDYIFDLENSVDPEMLIQIENLQSTLLNAITSFTNATYIEDITDDDRTLLHYELEYNVNNVIRNLFNYYNAQDTESPYTDFDDFLTQLELTDVFDLFKTFTIDIYFDQSNNDIGRIELDLVNLIDNEIFTTFIESYIPIDEINFDVETMIDYVQAFEFGVNVHDINQVTNIVVPTEAQNGLPIDQISAPFEPAPTVNTLSTTLNTINLSTTSPLTDTEISQAIESLIDANSFEANYQFKVKTDEMELNINPAFSFQKYTNTSDEEVYQMQYYNDIMEGAGLLPLHLIVDERIEMLYLSDANYWYKGTFDEVEDLAGEPIFGYLFDLENAVDPAEYTSVTFIQNTILTEIRNYQNPVFIETIDDNGRSLHHYEVELDVYNMAKLIFEHFNDQDTESPYTDFEDMLQQEGITDIANLFETFTVDIYFEDDSNQIGRIELDIMNLMNNTVIIDEFEQIFTELGMTVDVQKLMDYVDDIDFAINLYNVNNIPEITIPTDAEDGYPIAYLGAPYDFDPELLTEIDFNTSYQIGLTIFDDDIDEIFYTFTLDQEREFIISESYNTLGDWIGYQLYNETFDYIDVQYNSFEEEYIYVLPAGTYYLEVYGNGNGICTFSLEPFVASIEEVDIGDSITIDLNIFDNNYIVYYSFTLTDELDISIKTIFDVQNFDNMYYDLYSLNNGYVLPSDYDVVNQKDLYYNLQPGTYYIAVQGEGDGLGNIELQSIIE